MRITLSVPDDVAAQIKEAAGDGTVSGWVVKVIEEHLAGDAELEQQFDEWVAAQPPVDEKTRQRVDDVLEKALGIQRRREVA